MKTTKTIHRTKMNYDHLSSMIKVGTTNAFQRDTQKIIMDRKHQASAQNIKDD